MARPVRLELTTSGSGDLRSVQVSYGRQLAEGVGIEPTVPLLGHAGFRDRCFYANLSHPSNLDRGRQEVTLLVIPDSRIKVGTQGGTRTPDNLLVGQAF